MPKSKWVIISLFVITLLGAYLRLDDFSDLLRFNADQARDAAVIDDMWEKNDFPLLGPKAGGTTFKLGPAFYYMEYLSAAVFGHDPAGLALFIPILAVFSIPLLFIFFRFYFSDHISLFLTLLYSVSFFAIKYSRFAWNPNVIPFFLLVFLISLLNIIKKDGQKKYCWIIILGLCVGIGVQLHTTLLFLLPILLVSVFGYLYFKEKRPVVPALLLIILLAFLLNLPFFYYDFRNDGENMAAFWMGAEGKTSAESSFVGKMLLDGQFFVQGNFYAISSFEPQKNWLEAGKLWTSGNWKEITFAISACAFFLAGLILLIIYFRKEKDPVKKNFLGLLLAVIFLSYVMFWPIAGELSVRFFIILIFLPFLFIGLIFKFLGDWLNRKKVIYLAMIIAAIFISFYNLKLYNKIYDPRDYEGKSDIYGGISLKEARDISGFIVDFSWQNEGKDKKLFLAPFEFSRPVNYLNKKSGLDISVLDGDEVKDNSILFLVAKSKNEKKEIGKSQCCYALLASRNLGRFSVIALENKQ